MKKKKLSGSKYFYNNFNFGNIEMYIYFILNIVVFCVLLFLV